MENLPPQSPLYRLLVDCWARWLNFSVDEKLDREVAAADYDVLPAHFLSRCLVAAKRSYEARHCARCKPQGTGERCKKGHTSEDTKNPPAKSICTYHEHGKDDEEKARCILRWDSRRHLLYRRMRAQLDRAEPIDRRSNGAERDDVINGTQGERSVVSARIRMHGGLGTEVFLGKA